jgi:hypothetical protein
LWPLNPWTYSHWISVSAGFWSTMHKKKQSAHIRRTGTK